MLLPRVLVQVKRLRGEFARLSLGTLRSFGAVASVPLAGVGSVGDARSSARCAACTWPWCASRSSHAVRWLLMRCVPVSHRRPVVRSVLWCALCACRRHALALMACDVVVACAVVCAMVPSLDAHVCVACVVCAACMTLAAPLVALVLCMRLFHSRATAPASLGAAASAANQASQARLSQPYVRPL